MADEKDDAMEGGPGEEKPNQPDPKPAGGVEIDLGGKRYVVPESMAQSLKAHNDSYQQRLNEVQTNATQRINELTSTLQHSSDGSRRRDENNYSDDNDVSTRLFEDPAAVLNELKSSIKNEMRNEYMSERDAERIKNDFWSSFYKEHEELKGAELLVEAVGSKYKDALAAKQTTKEISDELARLSAEALVNLGAPRKEAHIPPEQILEGAGTPAPRESSQESREDVPGVTSISDLIRKRQRERREARTGRKATS